MEDNKICYKPAYKCAICGKEYSAIADRNRCETACLKQQEEDAKKAAEAKKKAEKESRKTEVAEAIKNANELMQKYIDDYGSYEFYCDTSKENDDKYFWPSRLLHNWMF